MDVRHTASAGRAGRPARQAPARDLTVHGGPPARESQGQLWNPGIAERAGEYQLAEATAGALGLELRSLEARELGALEAALEGTLVERVDGLFLLDNPVLTGNPTRVGAFALLHRLPMMSATRSFAAAGGLMAYGVNRPALYRRVAAYVDKLVTGAKPADLPVERPTEFDFVINQKTAQALALTIPPAVLQQATGLIQ